MSLNEIFTRRFAELHDYFASMPYQNYRSLSGRYVPDGHWRKWATSADSLIRAALGAHSSHYQVFSSQFAMPV